MHRRISGAAHRGRRGPASGAPVPAGPAACPVQPRGATFVAGEPQPPEEAGHCGYTHPDVPLVPKPLTQLYQCGIGLLMQTLTHHRERRLVIAGLTASAMRPRSNQSRGTPPLDELLDKGAAHAKPRRQGALRAAVFVRGTKNFLTKIERRGLHI